MRLRHLGSFGLSFLVATTVAAEPAPDGRRLVPYTNAWRMAVQTSSGKTINAGQWTDKFEIIDEGGRRIGRRTQVETVTVTPETAAQAAAAGYTDVTVTTINDFDPATFAPIARDVVDSLGRHTRVEFSGATASITRVGLASKADVRATIAVQQPVYDYLGGLYGLLLAALPLQPGQEFDLPVLRVPPGSEERASRGQVHVVVAGRATIATATGRTFETLRVDVERLQFFIASEPPYIIRLIDPTRANQVWTFGMF